MPVVLSRCRCATYPCTAGCIPDGLSATQYVTTSCQEGPSPGRVSFREGCSRGQINATHQDGVCLLPLSVSTADYQSLPTEASVRGYCEICAGGASRCSHVQTPTTCPLCVPNRMYLTTECQCSSQMRVEQEARSQYIRVEQDARSQYISREQECFSGFSAMAADANLTYNVCQVQSEDIQPPPPQDLVPVPPAPQSDITVYDPPEFDPNNIASVSLYDEGPPPPRYQEQDDGEGLYFCLAHSTAPRLGPTTQESQFYTGRIVTQSHVQNAIPVQEQTTTIHDYAPKPVPRPVARPAPRATQVVPREVSFRRGHFIISQEMVPQRKERTATTTARASRRYRELGKRYYTGGTITRREWCWCVSGWAICSIICCGCYGLTCGVVGLISALWADSDFRSGTKSRWRDWAIGCTTAAIVLGIITLAVIVVIIFGFPEVFCDTLSSALCN